MPTVSRPATPRAAPGHALSPRGHGVLAQSVTTGEGRLARWCVVAALATASCGGSDIDQLRPGDGFWVAERFGCERLLFESQTGNRVTGSHWEAIRVVDRSDVVSERELSPGCPPPGQFLWWRVTETLGQLGVGLGQTAGHCFAIFADGDAKNLPPDAVFAVPSRILDRLLPETRHLEFLRDTWTWIAQRPAAWRPRRGDSVIDVRRVGVAAVIDVRPTAVRITGHDGVADWRSLAAVAPMPRAGAALASTGDVVVLFEGNAGPYRVLGVDERGVALDDIEGVTTRARHGAYLVMRSPPDVALPTDAATTPIERGLILHRLLMELGAIEAVFPPDAPGKIVYVRANGAPVMSMRYVIAMAREAESGTYSVGWALPTAEGPTPPPPARDSPLANQAPRGISLAHAIGIAEMIAYQIDAAALLRHHGRVLAVSDLVPLVSPSEIETLPLSAPSRQALASLGRDAPAPALSPSPFADPALQVRYEALRQCILGRVSSEAWLHVGPRPLGSILEEIWCTRLPGRSSCDGLAGAVANDDAYVLRTKSGSATQEQLELLAFRRSVVHGWDVTASLQPWTGAFYVEFRRGNDQLRVGQEFRFASGSVAISVPSEALGLGAIARLDAEIGPYLRSAQSFRDQVLARLALLRRATEDAVTSHRLTVCREPDAAERFRERGGPNGAGMLDTCTHDRLTREEEQQLLTDARRDVGEREALVRASYVDLHAALMATLPLADCWPRPAQR